MRWPLRRPGSSSSPTDRRPLRPLLVLLLPLLQLLLGLVEIQPASAAAAASAATGTPPSFIRPGTQPSHQQRGIQRRAAGFVGVTHHNHQHQLQQRRRPLLMMAPTPPATGSGGGGTGAAKPTGSPQAPPVKRVYAYAHGFLSDERSFKGQHFARLLAAEWGQTLHLLNLNGPTGKPEDITYAGGLAAMDALYEREGGEGSHVQLTIFGSSLGGFLAARYAELHPSRVEKLVLLCPGFDRCSRWERLFGPEALAEWEAAGAREFEFKGQTVRIPYAFVTEAAQHPPFPRYACPALVIHGLRDEVVPATTSTAALFEALPEVKDRTAVLVVDDDHGLAQPATLRTAAKAIAEFLDLRKVNQGKATTEADKEKKKGEEESRIEVEQKFPLRSNDAAVRAALDAAIKARGGELKGQVIMTDRYYDLPGELLSLANVWLRQRSGVWELKVPAVDGEHPNLHAVACYREISGPEDCRAWLVRRFPGQLERLAHLDLPELLAQAGARVMARYTTHRSKYSIKIGTEGAPDGVGTRELGIDVDEADYGFGLIEIEECVPAGGEEVAAATARVHRLARELGLEAPGGDGEGRVIRGKLEEFIFRKDPAHHRRLVEAGVFNA